MHIKARKGRLIVMAGVAKWKIRIKDEGRWKDVGMAWLSGRRLRIRIDLGVLGTVNVTGFPAEDETVAGRMRRTRR